MHNHDTNEPFIAMTGLALRVERRHAMRTSTVGPST